MRMTMKGADENGEVVFFSKGSDRGVMESRLEATANVEAEADVDKVGEIVDQVSSSSSWGSPDLAMAMLRARSVEADTGAGGGCSYVWSIARLLHRMALSVDECLWLNEQGNQLTVVPELKGGEAGAAAPER